MRCIRLAGISAIVALLATGCFGSSHDAGSPVHTTGRIVTVGGPPPGSPEPISGAKFRLVGSNQSVNVRADDDGRFAVDLAPGRYRVIVTGHAPQADGGWLPTTPSAVAVTSATMKPLRLVVSIK
jgi:hypothetical protein